jgi:dipeptidyl-peptidase 4
VWSKAVFGDTLSAPLEDQVDALDAISHRFPTWTGGRVGIRGWPYGGALAAIAVLRRPEVFHAAVSGAAPHEISGSTTRTGGSGSSGCHSRTRKDTTGPPP